MWLHWVDIDRKDPRMVFWGLCSRCCVSPHWNEEERKQGEVSQVKFKSKMERKEKKKEQHFFFPWILYTQKLRISSYWWVGLSRRNTWSSLMLKLRQSYWSLTVISLLAYLLLPMDLSNLCFLNIWGCVLNWMHPYTKREICLEAPEKVWPVVLPRTPWTTPGDTCIYSLAVEGADALPPPHPLLDIAYTGLLLHSCKPASVPHDTGGRLECLCGSSCVSETVGARMNLSFRALSLVSQALVKLGNSSYIWMQWLIWWEGRVHIWCLGACVRM